MSRPSIIRFCHALARSERSFRSILFVLLASVLACTSSAAQTVPGIGSVVWKYWGADPADSKFRSPLSADHAVHAGIVLVGSESRHRAPGYPYLGELIAFNDATGSIVRADSVCPRFRAPNGGSLTILNATTTDSGNVVCYTCAADGVHFVMYPDFTPIADTMLRGAVNAWLSNTGRYLILSRPDLNKEKPFYLYDRQRGDTVWLDGGIVSQLKPYFSADDRYLLLASFGNPRVYNVEERRIEQPMVGPGSEDLDMSMSYLGNRVLVSGGGFAGVYDAITGTAVWTIGLNSKARITHNVISADGTEVLLMLDGAYLKPPCELGTTVYRFKLPELYPSGALLYETLRAGGLASVNAMFSQAKIPGRFLHYDEGNNVVSMFSHGSETGVDGETDPFTPILYPNPATSTVTMPVKPCDDASWIVSLHDNSGREMWTRTLQCVDSVVRFDVSGLPSGTYVVRATKPLARQTMTSMLIIR